MKSYRDLIVWQKSIDLVVEVYRITSLFPKDELYGLTTQMRRSSISISSNIAEGSKRTTKKDFRNFLSIAFGSGAELETQIEIISRLKYADSSDVKILLDQLTEIQKMLNKFIKTLG